MQKSFLFLGLLLSVSAFAKAQILQAPAEKNQLSEYNIAKPDTTEAELARIRKKMPPYLGKMSKVKKLPPKVYTGGKFNPFFGQSLFPLQDQTRFYNKSFEIRENKCNADGMFAIYNIRNSEANELQYDCVGWVNSACGPECFDDGVFFGSYRPQYACVGELKEIWGGTEDNPVLEQMVCYDEKDKVIWQRERDDNYVFDNTGRLMFFQNKTDFIQYMNSRVEEKYIYDTDEYMYYSPAHLDDYFHVKYERDGNGRIIKEFHFNQDGFPYYIFVADYEGNKCKQITKYDGYKGTTETFKF